MSQDNVVIVSGVRTPMGGFMGSLAPVSAPELGAIAIAEAVKSPGVPSPICDCSTCTTGSTPQLELLRKTSLA